MILTPININTDDCSAVLHPFLADAKLYDSSCSLEARVIFIDKGKEYFFENPATRTMSGKTEMGLLRGVCFMSEYTEINKKRDNKSFWNRYAKLYDWEINMFSGKAYSKMYGFMAGSLSPNMNVLEVATGTGLIAVNIAACVRHVEAIDFSPKMIETAKKKKTPGNVRFSVEDAAELSFKDNSFDAVIISNALHIIPEPVKVLMCISRVLKPKGLLIAPNFTHGHLRDSARSLNTKILKLIGFEAYSKWLPEEYVEFIRQNEFEVERQQVLSAAFPLVYLEAKNKKQR